MRARKRMEPTMAPTMMLVLVIPETEEERRVGSRMCVNWTYVSCFLGHVDTRGYTNHKTLQQNTKTQYI